MTADKTFRATHWFASNIVAMHYDFASDRKHMIRCANKTGVGRYAY